MTGCLNQMNNTGFNGAECVPNDNGNALGPTFGFWKKNMGSGDGQACYNACAPCLTEGINNQRAVTTSCTYSPGGKDGCWMGFNYGT